jgi:hypothetical protein
MAIIEGTSGNDYLVGISGNDTFKGSTGNDTIEGIGTGNTVTYEDLGLGIALKPRGVVTKGGLKSGVGTDQLVNIQTVVGVDNGSAVNTIDVSTVTDGFNVINLQAGSVLVQDNTGNFVLDLTVKNFRNVSGTQGNDTIAGTIGSDGLGGNGGNDTLLGRQGNDFLTGGGGSDIILGGSGDDVLTGAGSNGNGTFSRGLNEKDYLVGGAGVDIFVLGDSSGAYYFGDRNNGYAQIQDFSTSDSLVLGANQSYVTRKTQAGFDLFAKSSTGLDLIAVVTRDSVNGAAKSSGDRTDSFTIKDLQQLNIKFTPPAEVSVGIGGTVKSGLSAMKTSDSLVAVDPNNFDPFSANGFQEFTLASGQSIGNFTAA